MRTYAASAVVNLFMAPLVYCCCYLSMLLRSLSSALPRPKG